MFGYTDERRAERALIGQYEVDIDIALRRLAPRTLATAVALASLPDQIRGYGHIKERTMRQAAVERIRLLTQLETSTPQATPAMAAE